MVPLMGSRSPDKWYGGESWEDCTQNEDWNNWRQDIKFLFLYWMMLHTEEESNQGLPFDGRSETIRQY